MNAVEKELKLRQQIWQSSPELKELKAKLRAAYIAKELAVQIAEKRALAIQEKIENKQFVDLMEEQIKIYKDQEIKKRQETYEKNLQYREELRDQIIKTYKREEKYQEFLKEKALLDQIVKAIHEEDQREEEINMQRIHRTKQEIAEFCQMQKAWREKEKQALDEEDRRIKSYLAQREQEEKKRIKELKEKEGIKKHLQERIESAFILHHIPMNEKRERQDILHDLDIEALREQDLRRVKDELKSAVRKREQLKSFYRQQFEERRKRLMEEDAMEEIYRQQMLAQLAEDYRLHQLTAEKRRLKNLEHRRQVQLLIEEKKRQRAEEWEKLRAEEKLRQAEEKQRAQIIEEERIRMLQKHATKLLGYLPRSVLREDDLNYLGSEFLEQFNKLKANETDFCI